MPEASGRCLVTNTTPLIALTAATGGLEVLRFLFERVIVPLEVAEELRAGGAKGFGVEVFSAAAAWLEALARWRLRAVAVRQRSRTDQSFCVPQAESLRGCSSD